MHTDTLETNNYITMEVPTVMELSAAKATGIGLVT